MMTTSRWKLRYEGFTKALSQLQGACSKTALSDLERAGLIQYFEFTFELSWKVLKDFLNEEGVDVRFPREVIRTAIQSDLIDHAETWMDMLQKRNELAHTYDSEFSELAEDDIRNRFLPALISFHHRFASR